MQVLLPAVVIMKRSLITIRASRADHSSFSSVCMPCSLCADLPSSFQGPGVMSRGWTQRGFLSPLVMHLMSSTFSPFHPR
jgi:hypothetical protein